MNVFPNSKMNLIGKLKLCVIAVLVFIFGISSSAFAKVKIQSASSENGSIKINKSSSQETYVKSFVLNAEKPGSKRYVLDIKDADLVGKSINKSVSERVMLRINQFSTNPAIVRVVIEGPGEEVGKYVLASNSSNSIIISKKNSNNQESKQAVSSSANEGSEQKNISIEKISLENNELKITCSDKAQLKSFGHKSDGKEMLVFDLQKSRLSSSGLKTSFSQEETNSSEIIRIAQFDPETVRVVIEGPKSNTWKANSESESGKLLLITHTNSAEKIKEKENEEVTDKPILPQKQSLNSKIFFEGDNPLNIKIKAQAKRKIKYKMFRLSSPERLIVDLYDWVQDIENSDLESLQLKASQQTSLISGIRSGKPSQDNTISRLVFDLNRKDLKVDDKVSDDKQTLTLSIAPKEAKIEIKKSTEAVIQALRNNSRKTRVVLIDAGHGGYDTGALYGGIEEKEITLKIAKKLNSILSRSGIKTIMTRSNDVFVSLEERVKITQDTKPDFFVSIHCNALESGADIKGIESYYYTTQSQPLTHSIHKKLVSRTQSLNRHVRKARFVVIRETEIPSALFEVGFLSNSAERKKLNSDSYQNTIARAIADGIAEEYAKARKDKNK
jgi:N-acetylmuramoyl-L-alanine amidase